jgi:hypothetical protein
MRAHAPSRQGGPEDSAVVLRITQTYLQPLQEAMGRAAAAIQLGDAQAQQKLTTQSLLMKGHLLELAAAVTAQSAAQQLKEAEEVQVG